MAKGEFDRPSGPASDAYRDGWIHLYHDTQETIKRTVDEFNRNANLLFYPTGDDGRTDYTNGCPILSEDKK